jgi:hypothetical protein
MHIRDPINKKYFPFFNFRLVCIEADNLPDPMHMIVTYCFYENIKKASVKSDA